MGTRKGPLRVVNRRRRDAEEWIYIEIVFNRDDGV